MPPTPFEDRPWNWDSIYPQMDGEHTADYVKRLRLIWDKEFSPAPLPKTTLTTDKIIAGLDLTGRLRVDLFGEEDITWIYQNTLKLDDAGLDYRIMFGRNGYTVIYFRKAP